MHWRMQMLYQILEWELYYLGRSGSVKGVKFPIFVNNNQQYMLQPLSIPALVDALTKDLINSKDRPEAIRKHKEFMFELTAEARADTPKESRVKIIALITGKDTSDLAKDPSTVLFCTAANMVANMLTFNSAQEREEYLLALFLIKLAQMQNEADLMHAAINN